MSFFERIHDLIVSDRLWDVRN